MSLTVFVFYICKVPVVMEVPPDAVVIVTEPRTDTASSPPESPTDLEFPQDCEEKRNQPGCSHNQPPAFNQQSRPRRKNTKHSPLLVQLLEVTREA